jgi:hypothetical protein
VAFDLVAFSGVVERSSKERFVPRVRWTLAGLCVSASAVSCVIPLSGPEQSQGSPTLGDGAAPQVVDAGSLPKGTWTNVASNLDSFSCNVATLISVEPDGNTLLAGLNSDGLWTNSAGSSTWQELGQGMSDAGADAAVTIGNLPLSIVYDPENPNRFWENGIYGSGNGVYETMDNGNTFIELGTVGDAHRCDYVSVDFTDPARATLLAGGHEEAQSLFMSTNGGVSWTNAGAGLPTDTFCTYPLVLDHQTFLISCSHYEGPPIRIYRTTNAGASWTQVSSGFGAASPALVASDGTIYWATPAQGGLVKSTDQGKTWTQLVGPGVIYGFTPVELPDKTIATLGNLAGNQYGPIYAMNSSDGLTWQPLSAQLPIALASGFAYSTQRHAFYVVNQSCPDGGGAGGDLGAIMQFVVDAGTGPAEVSGGGISDGGVGDSGDK